MIVFFIMRAKIGRTYEFHKLILKIEIDSSHHSGTRHGIPGIDFIFLCQQVFTTCPDVQPAVHPEGSTQVLKHEIFGHHGVCLRIKSGNVLQPRRYVPPPSRETGSGIKFMFRSSDDRILHVKVTVISVYRPVAVDTVGSLYFYTRILYLSGVLVQHTTSVRIRQRLDKVLSVNKEQIDAILQLAIHQLL